MYSRCSLEEISIRTELQPGDLGIMVSMHSTLYTKGIQLRIAVRGLCCQGTM